jgi:hypothetical protein
MQLASDSDDDNLTIILLMTVLATQNLLILMCTTTYQNLGGIGVTLNESNGLESNGPSAGVTLTKFVCALNPMRTRWIRHFWIEVTSPRNFTSVH